MLKKQAKSDLLQILDDRVGMGSTIFVGQRPHSDWHEFIDDPHIADAVLDRLSSKRYHIKLKGDSQRRSDARLSNADQLVLFWSTIGTSRSRPRWPAVL